MLQRHDVKTPYNVWCIFTSQDLCEVFLHHDWCDVFLPHDLCDVFLPHDLFEVFLPHTIRVRYFHLTLWVGYFYLTTCVTFFTSRIEWGMFYLMTCMRYFYLTTCVRYFDPTVYVPCGKNMMRLKYLKSWKASLGTVAKGTSRQKRKRNFLTWSDLLNFFKRMRFYKYIIIFHE